MADGVPSVEFLLPFYGDPDLLRETIRSVLDQTDPDWTLTVVDDGYPDPEVEAWIRGLADDRITYHRNETNLGANGNYRKAISLATRESASKETKRGTSPSRQRPFTHIASAPSMSILTK